MVQSAMNDDKNQLAEIAQALKAIQTPLNALAVAALTQQMYSREELGTLIGELVKLKDVYEREKAENARIDPDENRDQLVSRLGAEEGEREFARRKKAFATQRAAWDAYSNFRDTHPLIEAMTSCAKAVGRRSWT